MSLIGVALCLTCVAITLMCLGGWFVCIQSSGTYKNSSINVNVVQMYWMRMSRAIWWLALHCWEQMLMGHNGLLYTYIRLNCSRQYSGDALFEWLIDFWLIDWLTDYVTYLLQTTGQQRRFHLSAHRWYIGTPHPRIGEYIHDIAIVSIFSEHNGCYCNFNFKTNNLIKFFVALLLKFKFFWIIRKI